MLNINNQETGSSIHSRSILIDVLSLKISILGGNIYPQKKLHYFNLSKYLS